jgi:predicted dehydrogenase
VNWDAFLGNAPKRPFDPARFFRWRCYWDYSGGIAGDLFVHLLTTIHYVMGATMPSTVLASGELYRWKDSREVPDTLNGLLIYPEGFTVNLSSTFNNESASESGFEILGTKGSIVFRGDRLTFTPESVHEDNRWVVTSWPRELEQAYYSDPKVNAEETPGSWTPRMVAGGETWQQQGQDNDVTHLANFVAAVRSRQQPYENAVVGHHAAAAAHMVNASLRQRRVVEWDFGADTVKRT